jgi:hypothetical protein
VTVNVALIGAENLFVTPGESATCQLSIANSSTIVEQFTLLALGEAMDWLTAEPPVVSLFPGAQQAVTLRFSPPRLPTTPSGEVPFAVKVIPSIEPEESVTEEGVITVGLFNDVAAELMPKVTTGRITGRQRLFVDSRGNVPIPIVVTGTDPADALKIKPRPSRLTAAPGESRRVRVRVKPRQRFWKGPQQQKPYKVQVAPEHEDPVVLDGSLTQKAVLPKWAYYAGLIAAALLLLWFFVLKPVVHSTAVNANKQALAAQAAQTKALQSQLAATQSTVATNSANNAANAAALSAIDKKLHVTTTTSTTVPKPTTTTTAIKVIGATPATPTSTSTTTTTATTIATVTPTTTPTTATTQPPPVTGPNDGRIEVVAAPGSTGTNSITIGSQSTLQIGDLIIQNVLGGAGRATIERVPAGTGNPAQALIVENLQGLTDQEYSFASPMVFTSRQQLVLTVACQSETACDVGVYYTGPLTQPQSDTTTTAP